jgi:hypothetical protein
MFGVLVELGDPVAGRASVSQRYRLARAQRAILLGRLRSMPTALNFEK